MRNPTLNKTKKDGKECSTYILSNTVNLCYSIAALRGVLKEQKYSDLTVNLFGKFVLKYPVDISCNVCFMVILGALAENNRLTKTQGVIKAYQTIMSAHRGEVRCTVTTAKVSVEEYFISSFFL